MPQKDARLLSLEEALRLLLENAAPVDGTKTLPLDGALSRVAAKDIASPIAVPPFDRSPLDGYCAHSEDVAAASRENPARLRVIGEACAGCGERFAPARGEALRVMTGAPVPPCCDCVIRQEDTDMGEHVVEVYRGVASGRNICRAGEDVSPGTVVLRAGERVTSAHIGVLASLGVSQVTVYRRVRAALLCTGDELCRPGEALPFGKIYDANRAALEARLCELSVQAHVLEDMPDDPALVAGVLREAAMEDDVLLTTGGVSVGKKDIFHSVLPLLGAERLFWQVAMKPGSPLLCARFHGKLLMCLSGNPFAALACFELLCKPVLMKLSGSIETVNPRVRTRLCGAFDKASPGRRFIRARFDGERAHLTGTNHSSGSLASMIGCNCLIDIPAGSGPLADGDEVEIVLL